MANDGQFGLPSLLVAIVIAGLIYKYAWPAGGNGHDAAAGGSNGARDSASQARQREAAVERIQQMFPQVDRRTILWDLQRNGGSIATTTERILSGTVQPPPISFQPPPPPGSNTAAGQGGASASTSGAKPAEKPAQPNLIQRYHLEDKIQQQQQEQAALTDAKEAAASPSSSAASSTGAKKSWSTNKDERQSLLQKRRDEMILAARQKMEAKIAAEKQGKAAAAGA